MKPELTRDRYLQILNNVSEEFVDHGETDFASKAELCQCINMLHMESIKERNRLVQVMSNAAISLLQGAMAEPAPTP